MPLPQSSLNLMCTYPDVLLYILLFLLCRVARILKRFVTRHERIDALVSVVLCLPAHLRVSRSVPWPAPHGNAWAQLSKLDAQQTNNQQAYTSVNSTGHMKAVDTINGIQMSNKPLLGIQTCRISSPCPT